MKYLFLYKQILHRATALAVLLLIFPATVSFAEPTSSEQAMRVVQNWRAKMSQPLGADIGAEIADVTTYNDTHGEALYHVVSMNPDGFVIVAGDDQVQPIIAFVAQGQYDPYADTFLSSVVPADMTSRVEYVRARAKQSRSSGYAVASAPSKEDTIIKNAENKWANLDTTPSTIRRAGSISAVADVRVAPLLTTKWDQSKEWHGNICYNYYTPQNRPAGCTATAFSQLMRYFAHDAPLPARSYSYYVEGSGWITGTLMGGDGSRGPYDWNAMVNGPYISSEVSRQAIGRLLRDAGVSIGMKYYTIVAGGSVTKISESLVNTFGYQNAIAGAGGATSTEVRNNMIIPNLDAGLPLVLSTGYHSVNCDGYGYDTGSFYAHINMGYSGSTNAWYALPEIRIWNVVKEIVYNVFIEGSGEIISGRVIDTNGAPIANIQVTATKSGGGTFQATTNTKGIYALTKIPSNSSYQITASKSGLSFVTHQVTTGQSLNDTKTVGNRWGINFKGTTGSSTNMPPGAMAGEDVTLVVGHSTLLSGSGVDDDGVVIGYEWMEGATSLAATQTFTYIPTSKGPHTLKLIVTDNEGAVGEDNLIVHATANNAPVANAGPDKTVTLDTYLMVLGKGTDDGSITTWAWYEGSQYRNGRTLYYSPRYEGRRLFMLKVRDDDGLVGTDTMVATFVKTGSTNAYPTVDAGADKSVAANTAIQITGSATDTDGSIKDYKWTVGSTLLSERKDFTYTPGSAGIKTLVLTVRDNVYATNFDTVQVNVTEAPQANSPPIANAGGDKAVVKGNSVNITGTATDSDGIIASWKWMKGTETLANTVSFTFSPTVAGVKTLTLIVTDNEGATGSDTMSVTVTEPPLAVSPGVSTQDVTAIQTTSAIGAGTLTALGNSSVSEHGFCWNSGGSPSVNDSCSNLGSRSATGAFSGNLSGLTAATQYYVRAYAMNSGGTAYGSDVLFTTASIPLPATVSTQGATGITVSGSTALGRIDSSGSSNISQHGFCWGTTTLPTATNGICSYLGAATATGSYSSGISGLQGNTRYYLRAYGTNDSGIAYGNEIQFTTLSTGQPAADDDDWMLFLPALLFSK